MKKIHGALTSQWWWDSMYSNVVKFVMNCVHSPLHIDTGNCIFGHLGPLALLLTQHHSLLCGGNFGVKKIHGALTSQWWWDSMYSNVVKFVMNCVHSPLHIDTGTCIFGHLGPLGHAAG